MLRTPTNHADSKQGNQENSTPISQIHSFEHNLGWREELSMNSRKYLSAHARGGAIASKVDQQDAVALWICLKIASSHELCGLSINNDAHIACEQLEDLAIVDKDRRILISVKTAGISLKDLELEIQRLHARIRTTDSTCGMLAIVGTVNQKVSKAIANDSEYRQLISGKSQDEIGEISSEFLDRYGSSFTPSVTLKQFHNLDSDEFKAGIAQLLRRSLPIGDYTDARIDEIILSLSAQFSKARRERSIVHLSKVMEEVSQLSSNPYARQAFSGIPYDKSAAGYVVNKEKETELSSVSRNTNKVERKERARFFKRHFLHALYWLLLGAPACLSCGHPLVANFCGLGLRGIACPSCNATPFITLFLACPCGSSITLLEQPDISNFTKFNQDIIQALNHTRCSHCGRQAIPEDNDIRIFQLNIPADDSLSVAESLHRLRTNNIN